MPLQCFCSAISRHVGAGTQRCLGLPRVVPRTKVIIWWQVIIDDDWWHILSFHSGYHPRLCGSEKVGQPGDKEESPALINTTKRSYLEHFSWPQRRGSSRWVVQFWSHVIEDDLRQQVEIRVSKSWLCVPAVAPLTRPLELQVELQEHHNPAEC